MTRRLCLLLLAVTLTLSGCGLTKGIYEVPLPGGPELGDAPITVTAEFEDALDLVPQSSVKLDQVDVGRVSNIRLAEDGRTAVVDLRIRGGLDLPADTTARLQQTSLLGEKFVALVPGSGSGVLADGARIDRGSTSQAVGVEEVLGALSMLLNGGGVGQFQTISRELQQIGGGRTHEIRQFLRSMHRFTSELDARRSSITDAIDGMHALSVSLNANREEIGVALTELEPGLAELADQRQDFVRMLAALDRLGTVTARTLQQAGDDMVADLKALEPVLKHLAEAGKDLPESLEILFTFPFPDAVLAAVEGDYLNLFITMNLDTTGEVGQPRASRPYPAPRGDGGQDRAGPPPLLVPQQPTEPDEEESP